MIALAKTIDWTAVPEGVRGFASPDQTAVTPGIRYVAAAVSVYKGTTFLLIVDDSGEPCFVPAWFFALDAGPVPPGWLCAFHLGGGVELVLGPEFIARNLDTYSAVVDHAPDVMAAVVQYVAERGGE